MSARAALVTLAVRRYHVGRVAALEMICRTPEFEAARKADVAQSLILKFQVDVTQLLAAMGRVQAAARQASKAFDAFYKAAP